MRDSDFDHRETTMLSLLNPLIFPLVPHHARAGLAALWQANARFAQAAREGREPALRQIKLRWWADQLAVLKAGERHPDPLLTSLVHDLLPQFSGRELSALAEDWMAISLDGQSENCDAGALLFTMSGRILGCESAVLADAGRAWAGIEQVLVSGDSNDWAAHQARFAGVMITELPRALAALTGLARTIARAKGRRAPRREQWSILRIGLFGR